MIMSVLTATTAGAVARICFHRYVSTQDEVTMVNWSYYGFALGICFLVAKPLFPFMAGYCLLDFVYGIVKDTSYEAKFKNALIKLTRSVKDEVTNA